MTPPTRLVRHALRLRAVGCAAALSTPWIAGAQRPLYSPERSGLYGSLATSSTWLHVDNRPPTTWLPTADIAVGYRLHSFIWRNVSLVPHLRGTWFVPVQDDDATRGLARVHLDGGAHLAARLGVLRPYAVWRIGYRSMEDRRQIEAPRFDSWPTSWGAGVEFPLRTYDQGIDLSLTSIRDTFDPRGASRGTQAPVDFRQTQITIGWSGRWHTPWFF